MKREAGRSSINSTTSSNQLLGFRFDFLRYADAVLVKTLTAQFFVLLLIKRKYVKRKYVNEPEIEKLKVQTTTNHRRGRDKLKRGAGSYSNNSTTSSNQLLGFRLDFLSYADAVFMKTLTAQDLLLIKRKYVKLYVETASNMKRFLQ